MTLNRNKKLHHWKIARNENPSLRPTDPLLSNTNENLRILVWVALLCLLFFFFLYFQDFSGSLDCRRKSVKGSFESSCLQLLSYINWYHLHQTKVPYILCSEVSAWRTVEVYQWSVYKAVVPVFDTCLAYFGTLNRSGIGGWIGYEVIWRFTSSNFKSSNFKSEILD